MRRFGSVFERRYASWRLPAVARLLVCVAALGGLIAGVLWVGPPYRDVLAYRHAPPCPAGVPGSGCVGHDTGTVLDKDTGENCSSDGNGGEHCTTYYRLQLRRAGDTEWWVVDEDIYRAAIRDDTAQLSTWHGDVVRLVLRGHTEEYGAPAENAVILRLAALWLLVGLAIWAVGSGYLGTLIAFPNFGWLFSAVALGMVGHGLLFGFSDSDGIALLFLVPFSFIWIRGAWWISGAGSGRWWWPGKTRSRR
jgi:hypothetical protein